MMCSRRFIAARRIVARRGLQRQEDPSSTWTPLTITTLMSAGCLVAAMHPSKQSSSYCLLEAGHGGVMPPRRIQRKRPPEFGATIPTLTRGRERLATNRNIATNDNTSTSLAAEDDNRNNCPMCKKFSAGPCGNVFQRWLTCTDCHMGKVVDPGTGQPLHLCKCADLAVDLAECLEINTVYYSKDEKSEVETMLVSNNNNNLMTLQN